MNTTRILQTQTQQTIHHQTTQNKYGQNTENKNSQTKADTRKTYTTYKNVYPLFRPCLNQHMI